MRTQEGNTFISPSRCKSIQVMKKVLFLLIAAFTFTTLQAQPTQIKSNLSDGADPAALLIEFLPTDAVVLPGGDIQIGVAPRAKVKNIGTKHYIHTNNKPLPIVLYQWIGGQYVIVKQTTVNILQPGAVVTLDYYTTYIKGKQQPPKFKIEVRSVAAAPNPDVNMNNNSQTGTAN